MNAGALARQHLLDRLDEDGINATLNATAFYPQPLAVLIGRPTLVARGLASSTFEVPVLIVSGDPIGPPETEERMLALVEDVADALNEANYRPTTYQPGNRNEPLDAYEVLAHVSIGGSNGNTAH